MEVNDNLPVYPMGVAAQILNVHPRTLRIYEAEGLIEPQRHGGKRMFSKADLVKIECLRKLIHEENISIPGIKKLLDYTPCWELKDCPKEKRKNCCELLGKKKKCREYNLTFSPIGVIHSPHDTAEKTPIQPVYAAGIKGKVEVYPEYVEGLKDLEGFSHIYLIYHFHKSDKVKLTVKPFLEDIERGLFSTRAPFRPNPIGLSIVKLLKIEDNFLEIENIDILNATPLLDIKPYTDKFDSFEVLKSGWQDNISENKALVKRKRRHQK